MSQHYRNKVARISVGGESGFILQWQNRFCSLAPSYLLHVLTNAFCKIPCNSMGNEGCQSSSHLLGYSEAGDHVLDLGMPLGADSDWSLCHVASLQVMISLHILYVQPGACSSIWRIFAGREGYGPPSFHLTQTKTPQLADHQALINRSLM